MSTSPNIALVNFGGIGDEILFTPVIAEIHKHLPDARMTLFLEHRSQSVAPILPYIEKTEGLDIQTRPRFASFVDLLGALQRGRFHAVISSGSNNKIPLLLYLSGIPVRVGFQTGATSRMLLSAEAPLDRNAYAANMYFSLASSFLKHLLKDAYTPSTEILPQLRPPSSDDLQWAHGVLNQNPLPVPRTKILIHPGVSLISIQKNILKGWPPTCWAQLITLLCQRHSVYLAGGPDDEAVVAEIMSLLSPTLPHFANLYGQTRNLSQLAALVQSCDLLLCVDSSPMHIAVGYQKPLVAMFGPTDEKKLLPRDPRFVAITRDDLNCRPCLWDVRAENCEQPVCLDVSVLSMAKAVEKLLSSPPVSC